MTPRLRGATVARLTPDQKAACSNHVGVKLKKYFFSLRIQDVQKGKLFKTARFS